MLQSISWAFQQLRSPYPLLAHCFPNRPHAISGFRSPVEVFILHLLYQILAIHKCLAVSLVYKWVYLYQWYSILTWREPCDTSSPTTRHLNNIRQSRPTRKQTGDNRNVTDRYQSRVGLVTAHQMLSFINHNFMSACRRHLVQLIYFRQWPVEVTLG